MGGTFIVLRYADGAIELTGWGLVIMISLAAWVAIFNNAYNGSGRDE